MANMFRLLRANEIDARIGTAKPNGVSLLLYKDARCDQNILDETVGPYNWQRSHSRDRKAQARRRPRRRGKYSQAIKPPLLAQRGQNRGQR